MENERLQQAIKESKERTARVQSERRADIIQDLIKEAKFAVNNPSISYIEETNTLIYNDYDFTISDKIELLRQTHDTSEFETQLFNYEIDLAKDFRDKRNHNSHKKDPKMFFNAGIYRITYLLENKFMFYLNLKVSGDDSLPYNLMRRDHDLYWQISFYEGH